MPALALLLAGLLAVVLATGAALDKKRVSRNGRVLIWSGLFLLLPFFLLFFYLILLALYGRRPC